MTFSTEPLVLRPPVGTEISGPPPRSARYHLLLRILGIFILLAVSGACIVSLIFLLGHSLQRFDGQCTVFTYDSDMEFNEHYTLQPRAAVISRPAVDEFPPVRVFHMLDDAATVMETRAVCYVYPMRPEVASAIPTDNGLLERIKEQSQPQIKVRLALAPQMWMLSPVTEQLPVISHLVATSNCSHLPIFRLIQLVLSTRSMPPSKMINYPLNCPEGCTEGESRDTIDGASPRQVCRCPHEKSPDFLDTYNSDRMPVDGESLSLEDDEDFSSRSTDSWDFENAEPVVRRRRRNTREAVRNLTSYRGCEIVDHLLDAALPMRDLNKIAELIILKCPQVAS
ncbi:unnamed protein product [Dibothriocephalus latus]|uniref:Uncharacterized protein n=1 Tax=Dibothriocephalus latus TaxID=60516 RepID=A0A3P7NH77_DIBLA|nr:unnamed protein product [Dibothriocephalus latus]